MATQHRGHHFTLPYRRDFSPPDLGFFCKNANVRDLNPYQRHSNVGVSSDPDAVSVKLGKSQTGSQTPSSLVGKRQNIKFSAEKEILFQSNLSLSRVPPVAGARLKIPSKRFSPPKKVLYVANLLENWAEVTVGSQNFFSLLPWQLFSHQPGSPLHSLPSSLSTHPPTHPCLVMVP